MDNWNKIFKPIVVLACICIVVTTALALTNEATAPIIAELNEEKARIARGELMPDAADFTQVSCDVPNVTDAYEATDGSGYILTTTSKGYGGTMVIMVAFGADGNILKIKVQSDGETPGIGDKVTKSADHWAKYEGLPSETLSLGTDVEAISGATISSKAVNDAVNSAIAGYQAIS